MGRVGRRVSAQLCWPSVRGPWRRRCRDRGREQRELRGREEGREGPLVDSGLDEKARGGEGRRAAPGGPGPLHVGQDREGNAGNGWEITLPVR